MLHEVQPQRNRSLRQRAEGQRWRQRSHLLPRRQGREGSLHKAICTEEKDATVEGKVVEKDKKKYIENPKVTFAKK